MRIEITLDCVDLDATAAFWTAALGYRREDTVEGRFVSLTGDGPNLSLQRVPEPKTGKNRMHLDLLVDDVDLQVARLHALGASSVPPGLREEFGQRWAVLADPEGNEFCVAQNPDR
jgi:catechol 2,3-dioxygenase-like lactoylglutathione lyase family enzyme